MPVEGAAADRPQLRACVVGTARLNGAPFLSSRT